MFVITYIPFSVDGKADITIELDRWIGFSGPLIGAGIILPAIPLTGAGIPCPTTDEIPLITNSKPGGVQPATAREVRKFSPLVQYRVIFKNRIRTRVCHKISFPVNGKAQWAQVGSKISSKGCLLGPGIRRRIIRKELEA